MIFQQLILISSTTIKNKRFVFIYLILIDKMIIKVKQRKINKVLLVLVIFLTLISIVSLIIMIIKGYTGANFISYTYPLCSEYLILKYGHSNSTVYIICFSFAIIKIFFNFLWLFIFLAAKDQKLSQQNNKIQNKNRSELEIKKYILLLISIISILSTIVVSGHYNSFLLDLENCEGSHPNEWTTICTFSYIQLLSFIICFILLTLNIKREQQFLNLLEEQTLEQKFNILDLSHKEQMKNNQSILSRQRFNQNNQKIYSQLNPNKFLERLFTSPRQELNREENQNQNIFQINKRYKSNQITPISNCQSQRKYSNSNKSKEQVQRHKKYLQHNQIEDNKFQQNSNHCNNPFQKLINQDQQKAKALRILFQNFCSREEQQLKKKKEPMDKSIEDQKREKFGKSSINHKNLGMKQTKVNSFDLMQKMVLNVLKDKFLQYQP